MMNVAPPAKSSPLAAGAPPRAEAPRRVRKRGLRRFLPGPIADGYLFETVLDGVREGVVMFAGLLFAFTIITAMRKAAEQTVPWGAVVQLIGWQMPRLILFTLPMALLYACVKTFSELSVRGEITALAVGGMSLWRMTRAPLVFAALLAVCSFWLQEVMVPRAEQARVELLRREVANAAGVQHNFKYEQKRADGGLRVLKARSINFKSRELTRPVLQIFNSDGTFKSELRAKRAKWDITNNQIEFFNASTTDRRSSASPASDRASSIEGGAAHIVVDYLDTSKFGNKTKTLRENLESQNYEMVSISELAAYRRELLAQRPATQIEREERDESARASLFGIHDKIATPLVCLALVLVGCPLGVRPPRVASGFSLGLSLIALLGYYVVWTAFSNLGKAGSGPPLLLAYAPLFLTLCVGLVLMRQKAM